MLFPRLPISCYKVDRSSYFFPLFIYSSVLAAIRFCQKLLNRDLDRYPNCLIMGISNKDMSIISFTGLKTYRTNCKKLFYVLCIMMVFGIFSIFRSALAEVTDIGTETNPWLVNTWSELYEKIQSSGYVRLNDDVTFDHGGGSYSFKPLIIESDVNIILDLNGHTIDRGLYNTASIGEAITVNGSLKIIDTINTGSIIGGNGQYGGGVYVAGELVMDGGIIRNNKATFGGGVFVRQGGIFTLTNGAIEQNVATRGGGGVFVEGTFSIQGGSISSNDSEDGGGVCVTGGSSTMIGGIIADNNAGSGGGVYVGSGIFTLEGGQITRNVSTSGGGGAYNTDNFTMNGGTISHNAGYYGGGLANLNGTFFMTGGEITNNSSSADKNGGGVCIDNGGFQLSGSPEIYDNVSGGSIIEGVLYGGVSNNIYLEEYKYINITGFINNENKIGVILRKGAGIFTNSNEIQYNDISKFKSDNDSYTVGLMPSGQLSLGRKVTLTYNNNIGSENIVESNYSYYFNSDVPVLENSFTRDGYTFTNWNTNPDGSGTPYDPNDIIRISNDTILYAQWQIIPAAITSISTEPANVELNYGYMEKSISVAVTTSEDTDYALSYQWYLNDSEANIGGMAIENAINSSYTIPLGKNAGITEYYYCVVTAARGDNGDVVTIASDVVSVTISKAVWENKTTTGSAIYGISGEVDLSDQIAPGSTIGNILFKDENGFETTASPEMLKDIPTITSGILRYEFKNDSANVNKSVVICIPVSNNENFYDYEIEVTLTVLDKNKETLALTQTGTSYGTELPEPVYTPPEGSSHTLKYSGVLRKDGSTYGPTDIKPTEAGNYSLTVICEAADTIYTGSAEFTIDPADISEISVTLGESLTYNGSEQTQIVSLVEFKSENIINECIVTNNTGTNAGDYTLTVTAKDESNYSGSVEVHFTVAKKNIIPVIEISGTYSFTGTEIIPVYEVKDGESLLAESDYNTILDDNINAGTDTGKMTVSAADSGNYAFEQQTVNFTIKKAAAPVLGEIDVSDFYTITSRIVPIIGMPANAGELEYILGTVIAPERLNTSVMIDSNDCINISLSDGMAEDKIIVPVTIRSINYEDASVNIVLTLCEKEDAKISIMEDNNLVETALTKIWGESLNLSSKADVSGENGFWTWRSSDESVAAVDNSGNVSILQTGMTTITAEYESLISKGQSSFLLTVEPKDISDSTVSVSGEYIYNGEAHMPENNNVTVSIDGFLLNDESDYLFTASNNINAGTAQLIVSGRGNYTGTASGSFSIAKAVPILFELPVASVITYGQTLSDSRLSGGEMKLGDTTVPGVFSWAAPDIFPTIEDNQVTEYDVTFTPNDTDNFESITCKLLISVNPGVPGVTPPSAVQNLIYNGEEQNLVTGGDAENGVIVYSVNDGAYANELPKGMNAGNYIVSWYVKGNKNYGDSGSESEPLGALTIAISHKEVTVTAEDKAKLEGEADPLLTVIVEGVLGTDEVKYNINREEGENAGTYIITPSGETTQGNYTITYKTGTLTITTKEAKTFSIQFDPNGGSGTMADQIVTEGIETVLTLNSFTRDGFAFAKWNTKANGAGVVYEDGAAVVLNADLTLYAQWEAADQQERIEQKELTSIPKELVKIFASLFDLKFAMIRNLMIQGKPALMERTVFYDIVLFISLDGGITWITATENNFPIDGIWITLPYPTGTGKNTHHFSASHMFTKTSRRLGTKAGDVEIPSIIPTDEGLRMKLHGLSPVAIAWSPIENEDIMEIPVEITIVQENGVKGVPYDVKDQTISLTILLKQENEIKIQSESISLDVIHGGNVKPINKESIKFTPKVPNFKKIAANYNYEALVNPNEIEANIHSVGNDVPVYNLKAVVGFNGEKFKVTLFWILKGESGPDDTIQVYPLPEDEIGAYVLRQDGTKEYLIFQTYDICMEYLGKDELCSGPQRCFHK